MKLTILQKFGFTTSVNSNRGNSRSFESMKPSIPPALSPRKRNPVRQQVPGVDSGNSAFREKEDLYPRFECVKSTPVLSPGKNLPGSDNSSSYKNNEFIQRSFEDTKPAIPALSPKRMHARKNDIPITSLDHIIKSNGGTTVATERLPTEMEQSKHRRVRSDKEEILELNRRVGRLTAEVAFLQQSRASLMEHYATTVELYQGLQGTVNKLQYSLQRSTSRMQEAENELLRFWGINVKHGSPDGSFI